MKTNLYLFKISVFTVLLLFAHINVFGTGKIAAQLKDNQTLVVDFFHTDTVLIIVPEACELSAVDKADIENAIFWENDQPHPAYI